MNDKIKGTFERAKKVVRELYEYFCVNEAEFIKYSGKKISDDESIERLVCDFIAGMTDSFALSLYNKVFLPRKWQVD